MFCWWNKCKVSFFSVKKKKSLSVHSVPESAHSSVSIISPLSSSCLMSCCLTLLCCPSHSLFTSYVALLWPFTLSFPLLSLNLLLPWIISSSFPIHLLMLFSAPLPFLPPSPICWCSAVSATLPVLTKCGADIGKMPQNMAGRQRHHEERTDIFYQMSLSPDQPSLSSRGNRSAFWHPVTHTGHTQHTNISSL